jgi:hypothetical protein
VTTALGRHSRSTTSSSPTPRPSSPKAPQSTASPGTG